LTNVLKSNSSTFKEFTSALNSDQALDEIMHQTLSHNDTAMNLERESGLLSNEQGRWDNSWTCIPLPILVSQQTILISELALIPIGLGLIVDENGRAVKVQDVRHDYDVRIGIVINDTNRTTSDVISFSIVRPSLRSTINLHNGIS